MDKLKKALSWFLYSYIWLAILLFVIDIVTKNIIVNNMIVGSSVDLIPGFLRISYQVNSNFAFSSSLNMSPEAVRIVFCIIAFIGIGVILFFYIHNYKKHNKLIKACLMMLLVGAVGNLIDRLFYSPEYLHNSLNGVVDWIDFYGIWSYVFNWADSCLVVSAFTLLIYFIVIEIKDTIAKRNLEAPKGEEKILSKDEKERLESYEKVDQDENNSNK